jgi:hypothetical protein
MSNVLDHSSPFTQDTTNRFCPLIMAAGRPRKIDPGTLYTFAHQFYWDFRRLSEGKVRWRFNEKRYQTLRTELEKMPLIDDADRAHHREIAEQEIARGELDPRKKTERLRDIEDAEVRARKDFYHHEAVLAARDELRVPGESDVIEVLLNPRTTPQEIRELCKESLMTRIFKIGNETREVEVAAWPIVVGSTLPTYISEYAEQYVAALNDPRFPSCDVSDRPSSRLKQFWFLSRALAGALYGVRTRTAINLVGSLRPEESFEESRDAKPSRRRLRYTRKKVN